MPQLYGPEKFSRTFEIPYTSLSIPNDKSYGLYSSPAKLLKLSSSVKAPVLSELLNISIKSGSYPSKLKIAKITPIFKSDDESDANNSRPISLLSNFSTIFKRMTGYIGQHNLLYPSQYGFFLPLPISLWSERDLNPRPTDFKSGALTTRPRCFHKRHL